MVGSEIAFHHRVETDVSLARVDTHYIYIYIYPRFHDFTVTINGVVVGRPTSRYDFILVDEEDR